jgi:hypothetical protein
MHHSPRTPAQPAGVEGANNGDDGPVRGLDYDRAGITRDRLASALGGEAVTVPKEPRGAAVALATGAPPAEDGIDGALVDGALLHTDSRVL